MIINKKSQLGLRFTERDEKVAFLKLMKLNTDLELDNLSKILVTNKDGMMDVSDEYKTELDNISTTHRGFNPVISEDIEDIPVTSLIDEKESKNYLICESVYKCAEMIRISENFTGRTIKDINLGSYTYLMGKNIMTRFVCVIGGIRGFYYDSHNGTAFYWTINIKNGDYNFNFGFEKEFTQVMRLLTFIELGDIEIVMIEAGRNNGGTRDKDKLTNTSENTVYVVDSTWNQILIRTDGFAVRGHFRLQPCGPGLLDRKLMWIDAFEKHGYTRRAKATIAQEIN